MAAVIASQNIARIQISTGILTAAQINGMDRAHNPILLLPAPGPNLTYIVHAFYISSTRTVPFTVAMPTNFWVAIGSQDTYDDVIVTVPQVEFLTQIGAGGGNAQLLTGDPGAYPYDFTVLVNNPLYLSCANPINGGNGTCKYYLLYSTVSVL